MTTKTLLTALGLLTVATFAATAAPTADLASRTLVTAKRATPPVTLTHGGAAGGGGVDAEFEP